MSPFNVFKIMNKHLMALTMALFGGLAMATNIAWIVADQQASIDYQKAADVLSEQTGWPVQLIKTPTKYLSAWARTPTMGADQNAPHDEMALAFKQATKATHLIVTPSSEEPEGYTFLGLTALQKSRAETATAIIVAPVQAPVYQMKGLCNNPLVQYTARLAIGADAQYVALPKVWQEVYTDDNFYNGRVPKTPAVEAYIFGTALAYFIDKDLEAKPLPGVHADCAEDLIDSIEDGLELTENVLFAAQHIARQPFALRKSRTFSAVLYDGDFEHLVGDWLLRLAKADGRELTLYYTTDTTLDTGLPALFRTSNPPTKAKNATLYTRPAFEDSTALTELAYLPNILDVDGKKSNWLPFQLAVSEWVANYPYKPVYNGALPTETTAAMFATMLYLKWTGTAVMPPECDQAVSSAIGIGLRTMLQIKLQRADVNAIFFRPYDKDCYHFSLWRAPRTPVTIHINTTDGRDFVSENKLQFNRDNYWMPQAVTVKGPTVLLWDIPVKQFPGQNTGVRHIQ